MPKGETSIVRPGKPETKSPTELLGFNADNDIAERWRMQMERISESERTAEQDSANIRIR